MKKTAWPKEMLNPRFNLGDEVEVHSVAAPLYGHVLGKDVEFGGNGSLCTIVGMTVMADVDDKLHVLLYRLHFEGTEEHPQGFSYALPADKLKLPNREGTICSDCIFWCRDGCDNETRPQPDGSCDEFEEYDEEWEINEDDHD